MFTDEDIEPIEIKSQWKKERNLCDSSVQTKDLDTHEVSVQSIKRKTRQTQTEDDYIEEEIQLLEDDSPELMEFMRKIKPVILKELQKSKRSHAFDGYDATWGESSDQVTNLHTLSHSEFIKELQITSLSWNATGSVIAAAYGRFDHEDWCTHKSALCTWNLNRRNLDPNKPDTVIDLSCCLMCLSFHPQKPSMIVGGTFNGEVLVWDTGREDDMLLATSGIGNDSHREPVSKVQWIEDHSSKSKKYQVVSVSGDGKILVWQMHSKKQTLKLVDGFILLTESLPRHLRVKAKRGDQEMGVTCISYSPLDDRTFLIGSESGGIFKCSSDSRGTPAGRDVVSSVPITSPVTFCFTPHHGPVYSVDCSPSHRNLFVSCGTDNSARIYSMLQMAPLVTLEPGAGYLYAARWSPVRPLVLAVTTETGALLVYDLKTSRSSPVLRLEASKEKKAVYSLEFNPHQPRLVATGDGAGYIQIWSLRDDLVESSGGEVDLLNEIAGTALET